jgi:hypothetical protein
LEPRQAYIPFARPATIFLGLRVFPACYLPCFILQPRICGLCSDVVVIAGSWSDLAKVDGLEADQTSLSAAGAKSEPTCFYRRALARPVSSRVNQQVIASLRKAPETKL